LYGSLSLTLAVLLLFFDGQPRPVQALLHHQPLYYSYATRSTTTLSSSKSRRSFPIAATKLIPQEKEKESTASNADDTYPRGLLLETLATVAEEAKDYADTFGFTDTEATFYAVFAAIRKSKIPLGFQGHPFVLRRDEIVRALPFCGGNNKPSSPLDHFFTLQDFAKAVEDDFLDAARGSTDDRKGWKVSKPNASLRHGRLPSVLFLH
jgi:hypothetical protein